MPRTRENVSAKTRKKPPARSPEGREDQLIALAVDLAEKQLSEGTASAQVITHFLKLASTKENLEREKLEQENLLLKAKTEQIKSQQKVDELYLEAIQAMKTYNGLEVEIVEED